MRESEKSSSNMPTVLILILALLGLATFPQGGGKLPDSSTRVPNKAGPAGAPQDVMDDEKNLGPLATIKADRLYHPSATKPKSCQATGPPSVFTGPGKDELDEILLSEPDLRFLIALVPDPDGASMSHEFDLTLGAVQRGTESAGFVAVRWSGMQGFPPPKGSSPSAPDPRQEQRDALNQATAPTIKGKSAPQATVLWPASVLCRASSVAAGAARNTHLLILLVPESPTWGVDKVRLATAVDLVARHRDLHKDCQHTPAAGLQVRIVGPNFSGSVRSMIRVLQLYATEPSKPSQTPDIVIHNGRAVAADLELFQELPRRSVRFRSTTYTNANLREAFREFVKEITPPWGGQARIALLNESNTGFGQQVSQRPSKGTKKPETTTDTDTESFSFPLNISQIREEYAAKGYLRRNEPLKLQSPERLSPLEMIGRQGDRDLVPVVTPAPSAAGGEMNLSQVLVALERGHFTWVGINATNPYDRIFLAEKVRIACPDARLFFLNASTLYSHPTAVPYMRGTLVVSTYPLDPGTQTWTASPGSLDGRAGRLAFGNHYEEAIYNATVAHLADMGLDTTPNLLDYAYPGEKAPIVAVPSVWIGVVGQRGNYPLRVQRPDPGWLEAPDKNHPEIGGLYRYKEGGRLPDAPTAGVLDASWVGLFLTAAFASIIVSLLYLWLSLGPERDSGPRWLGWARVSPGLRQVVDHNSARKLAAFGASAAFGQMVLLSAPAWVLNAEENLVSVGAPQRALAVLACLGLGVAAMVALYRMLMAGGTVALGLGETLYRALVAAVALAQIALPVWLLVAMEKCAHPAELSLFCIRATRLVNGVTPMVPVLLLGLAGGIIILGDWRRVGLRVRMNATGEADALDSSPLAAVWERFRSARRALDVPPRAWGGAGLLKTLPMWVFLSLLGILLAHGLPLAIEPYPLYLPTVLLAFGSTLILLVIRMVDLFGLCRELDLLLRRLAEVPLARAFDRVPAHFAHESFWRPNSISRRAEADSDPRIDRQFGAVVVGYGANRDAMRKDGRLGSVDAAGLQHLIATYSSTGKLPTQDWWPAVGALVPFLAPYWAARAAIPNGPADDAGEWAGLTDDDLRRWLRSAEDLIAMVMVRQIAWLRAAVNTILGFLVVSLVMMTLVLTSYPFEPRSPMFTLLGALAVIALGTIVVIAVQASRDEVLSRLNKTVTDRFTFDRQFLTTIITFVMPLLGLLGALSYSLSDLFRSLLEPFLRVG